MAVGDVHALDEGLDVALGDDPVAFAEAYVTFAIEHPGAYRATFGAHVAELDLAAIPEAFGPGRATRTMLADACAEIVAAEHLAVTGRWLFAMMWSVCHGTSWLYVQQEFNPDEVPDDRAAIALARSGAEALLDGLRPARVQPTGRR